LGKIIRDLILNQKTEKKECVDNAKNLNQKDVIIALNAANVFW
jgi:hypothetical protein